MAEKEAAEDLKVENVQKEKELTEQKKQAAKVVTEKDKEKEGTPLLFNVKDIANKTEAEVEKLLGKPSDTEIAEMPLNKVMTDYKLNYYQDEKIEVMFVENKAVNIFLNLTEDEYFTENDEKKNLGYLDLTIVDLKIPIVEGQISVGAYGVDGFYRVEVGKWRNAPGGSVSVFTKEMYVF